MIQLIDISKTFKTEKGNVEVLKEININVEKGEIFGVIGYSGAGKSTLLRMVNLLEKPSSGLVKVDGINLLSLNTKKLRDSRKKIGVIFQQFNLLNSYSVYDNISEILKMNRVPKQTIKEKVESLLNLVGLSDKASEYPALLSGGQRQRVGIARALAMDPEVLLCDEATSALDPETTDSILELLLEINNKLGLTILLITHEMDVIKKVCDRVAVMEKGEIIEQGSVLDIFSKPTKLTTKSFIKNFYNDSLSKSILENIKTTESSFKILRVTFRGKAALEPVLDIISSRYHVITNVLSGSITDIKGTPLGVLMLHIAGEEETVSDAIAYLRTIVFEVEIKLESNVEREVSVV